MTKPITKLVVSEISVFTRKVQPRAHSQNFPNGIWRDVSLFKLN